MSEWGSFYFLKTLEFDYDPDIIDLLNDKSVSPSLNEWSRIFPASGWFNIGHKPLPRIFTQTVDNMRKLIPAFLISPHLDVVIEMERYGINGLAEKDKIVQFVSKELELKLEGRFFSLQTMTARILQTTLEKKMATGILTFLPHQ